MKKALALVSVTSLLFSTGFDTQDGAPIAKEYTLNGIELLLQEMTARQYLCGQIRDMACEIFSLTR